ncbi:MAG: DUF1257 domain-containing protein [Planctomycetota bacterium]
MSHIVEIKTQVKDVAAVQAACRRLKLAEPQQRTVKVFTTEATGLSVQLPEWTYPIVCDTSTGEVKFDNFGGAWGQQSHLDHFLQAYTVEKAKLEARRQGYTATEQLLANGSIQVSIHVGGAA